MSSAPIQVPPQGHFADIYGFRMYYEIHGEGLPLLLLHNFTGSTLMWSPFIADFAKHYQLIVADLRGHGRSTNPANQFAHKQAAFDVLALLDHLGINRFMAMGMSSGGMTMLHVATQQPERVEKMVLIGATTYYHENSRAIQRQTTPAGEGWNWEMLRERHLYGDEQIRMLLSQFHDFAENYDDMAFTPPYLATIKAKTLIVHGDRDAHFPISIAVEMYRSIPNSYLWIVPNGDHIPIFGKRAPQFTQTALAFLQGGWDAL